MNTKFIGNVDVDDQFELINTFNIIVPKGYNHSKRLDLFSKEHCRAFYYYNDAITDKNYANATTKLKPSCKLKVKIFEFKKSVSSKVCMAKLRSEKGILVGAQGVTLVWEQKQEELPVNRWSISLDEEEALWKDAEGNSRVPCINRFSVVDFRFDLGDFKEIWHNAYSLLCFCSAD